MTVANLDIDLLVGALSLTLDARLKIQTTHVAKAESFSTPF